MGKMGKRDQGQPAFQNFHLTAEQEGLALIAVLRQVLPGQSWSAVRRLIHNRHVQINGNLSTDEARRLKAEDVVKVWQEPRAAPPQAEDVKIRHLDAHLVVVEKPAGVTTVRHSEEQAWSPRRRQLQPTLDEIVRRILGRKTSPKQSGRGGKAGRSGQGMRVRAVHRLDRDTSGLMILALSAEAQRRLVRMFRKHQVRRVYQAIVPGRVESQTFASHLVRDRGDKRRGSTSLPGVGKRAVTHVRPLEFLADYTLLECRLETGRTHQIRIHLAEAGHPVCGEKVYNQPLFRAAAPDRSGASRQALHAAELSFNHPISGEPLSFTMPLPADMARLLARLRGGGQPNA
jgi:23S rRNA pseudouridine1911/1915/1917 synthase